MAGMKESAIEWLVCSLGTMLNQSCTILINFFAFKVGSYYSVILVGLLMINRIVLKCLKRAHIFRTCCFIGLIECLPISINLWGSLCIAKQQFIQDAVHNRLCLCTYLHNVNFMTSLNILGMWGIIFNKSWFRLYHYMFQCSMVTNAMSD